MIKITGFAFVAVALMTSSMAFAADKAADKSCCAQNIVNKDGTKGCADLTSMGLNDDQKGKIETWQAECMKGGCTKESRHKFMQQAKGILSAEQFAKLKSQCKRQGVKDAKTQS